MIEYVKGELTELTPALAVVEAGGVGYGLNISLTTFSALQGRQREKREERREERRREGTEDCNSPAGEKGMVKLYVHEALVTGGRDDSFTLYGFATRQERELYRQLITVSGVGANTARMILSSIAPDELCNVIATGNERMLKSVKGIGLRTAQRIIVDLKDKIDIPALGAQTTAAASGAAAPAAMDSASRVVRDEAISALTMLGFAPAPTAKVVSAIMAAQPDLPVEQVVKLALKQIK